MKNTPASGTGSRNLLAIVSPCSSCKNQLAEPKDGRQACPRRFAERLVQLMKDEGKDSTEFDHLIIGGGSQEGSYQNPVYWDEGKSVLVWAATLSDNPEILMPGFDTANIRCCPYPFVPGSSEASYFQHGSFAEGDQLEVSFTTVQQLSSVGAPFRIDGFARKVNFLYNFPRRPIQKDLVPSGT